MSVSDVPAPSDAATGQASDTWRSLDWRFLIGTGRLGRVALVGTYSAEETAALRDMADSVDRFPTVDALGRSATAYDVVATRAAPMDHPGRTMAAVRPGGWLHLGLPAGAAAAPVWGRYRQGVTAMPAWHAPSSTNRSYLVPLDVPGGVRHALSRYDGARAGRTRAAAARVLLQAGAQAFVLRDRSVVMRRGGPARDLARSYLNRHGEILRSSADLSLPLGVAYLTPRFPSSRHVLALLVDARTGQLQLVVKLPRRPADRWPVEHEGATLDRLRATGCGPLLVALDDHEGQPLLVQTAVSGRPLDPVRVRRDPGRAVDLVLHFLDRLPTSGARRQDGWWDRLVAEPLARFAALRPSQARLVERTLHTLEPLRCAGLPSVIEHGDLSNPNLLVDGDELRAVDWELAELAGLPGHDLTFFLQYVADAQARATTGEAQCDAFDEAFLGHSAWGRAVLARHLHALSVASHLLPALVVACWARRSVARLRSADPGQPVERLISPRDLALWRHAVDRLAGT